MGTSLDNLSASFCLIIAVNIRSEKSECFPDGSAVKNSPARQEMRVWVLGWEDPLEEGMVAPSSTLAWEIPWTEESGWLQSVRSQSVRHDWCDLARIHTQFVNVCFTIDAKIHELKRKKRWIKTVSSKICYLWMVAFTLSVFMYASVCAGRNLGLYKSRHHFLNIFIYSNLWKLFLHIFLGLRLFHFSEMNI